MSWKFNPPPGWPLPPDGSWLPPPGWQPDPAWPPAPPGWEFWVPREDAPPPPPTQPPFSPPPAGGAFGGPHPSGGFPPGPPAAPARSYRAWWVAGIVSVVLVVGCGGGAAVVASNWDRVSDDEPPVPTAPPAAAGGWADCPASPRTCNGGEVTAGGALVWAVQGVDGWNVHTTLGATPTGRHIMTGVAPSTGGFLPDGLWQWNLDLLAAEPELVDQDPQTWVYDLRQDAIWSDGTPISAADFEFLWRHNAGDPDLCDECTPIAVGGYERIAEVTGDDQTVTVTLAAGESYPDWYALFTHLYPAHLAEDAGYDLDTPEGVGLAAEWFDQTVPDWSGGPWQVGTADPRGEVVLLPHDAWYGQIRPALDRLVFRVIDDPLAQVAALQAGEVDGIGPRPDPAEPVPEPAPGFLSHTGAGYAWDHIDFNLERPGLDDVALRQAVFTAIDIDQIIDLAYRQPADGGRKLNHVFRPDSPFYTDHLTATGQGSGDPTAARAILEQAGYAFDGDALTRDGEPVGPLVLAYSTGHARRTIVAELVAEHLRKVGIEVDLRDDQLFTLLQDRDYDLVIYGWSGTPAVSDSGYEFWHSESPSNFGGYQNSTVDELVTEALSAPDLPAVAQALNEANAIVAEEAYALPIAHTPEQLVVSEQFRNVRPNPAGTPFYNSHEWGLAAGG